MLDKRRTKRLTIIILCALLAALAIVFAYFYRIDNRSVSAVEEHVRGNEISFSLGSGMYEDSIEITLTANPEFASIARIYYTLNGDDPDINSASLYHGPIVLPKTDKMTVYPLKAVVYYDGEYSDICEKTYVLCDDASNEYDIYAVSITTDSDNLYDYDTGIFAKGKTYDDIVAEQGTAEGVWQGNYINKGEDWIRDAHTAIFDGDGKLLAEQGVGLSVAGGTSTHFGIKSLKLHAGDKYDNDSEKLDLILENEDSDYLSYSEADQYSSIRLRSGSQDIEAGNIRSAVVSRLAQQCGFDGITSSTRSIVFLNGEFYGIFDIQQNYSSSYLANRFGLEDSDSVTDLKGAEATLFNDCGLSELFSQDLNDEDCREQLEESVDMDNYLMYYAIGILCKNTDWPGNNFELWKYTGEYDADNPYTDGRYRFLIYDTDLTYTSEGDLVYFDGCNDDIFVHLMENKLRGKGSLFVNVMASDYYRDKFVTLICDLENTVFTTDNILSVIDEENERVSSVRETFCEDEYIKKSSDAIDRMRGAVQRRPEQMADNFETYFGLTDKYDFALDTSEGASVSWLGVDVYQSSQYKNEYYSEVGFDITAEAYPGYTFLYWDVNGEKVYGDSLHISGGMASDGALSVRAVAGRTDEQPVLLISEVRAKGNTDQMKVSNAGAGAAHLSEYYLSDSGKNLKKYKLPDITLQPGDSIIIYGSKNREAIGDYICDFSLSDGETLTLSDGKHVIDSIKIPKMSASESYGRYDNSGRWVYYKQGD